MNLFSSLSQLNKCIIKCRLCPRLVKYRESVVPIKSLQNRPHWRKPVPGFGDPHARLLITGLAPSAQGGNRTGRIFTGDGSARFLIKALYDEGFANQPTSESMDDGLKCKDCYITAAVKCVPPHNKPSRKEELNCSRYYENELYLLKNVKCILALGKTGFDAYLFFLKSRGHPIKGLKFQHGAKYDFEGFPSLYASYHPSPQNTQTGKLTETMFRKVLKQIKADF